MATRSLNVVISGDTRKLNGVLGQTEGRLAKFAKMGAVAGAALTTGLGLAINAAANFEAQLDSLGAVSDASAEQMGRLKKQAMDAGAATKFSALEAAKAQTELAKGGVSLEKILSGGLNGALALAAAGEMELADAATATANALNLFQLNGRDAGHVADALATAANSTTADVADFALALTQGGAAAKAAGLDLDETVVALEALANAGVKGSDAGTSLKAMLAQLAAPTERQSEMAKKLNIDFFDQQGNMKGLADISEMLRKRMGDMTKEQQLQTVKTLAGTDGMRAMLALFDAGPAKIEKLSLGLEKEGTAAEVAAKKQDNFKGKLENFMGSVETLSISLGSKLLPALTDAASAGTRFINGLQSGEGLGGRVAAAFGGVADSIRGLVTGFQQGAASARLLAAGLGAAVAGFAAFRIMTTVAAGVAAVRAAWVGMTVAMAANPIGAVAVGVAAVAAALGVMSIKTRTASASSRDLNDALRAQEDALRAVRDIDIDVAQRKANLASANVAVEQAEKRLRNLRQSGHASAVEIRQAEADLKQARVAQARSTRDVADVERDATRKRQDATEKTEESRLETARLIASKKDDLKATEDQIGVLGRQAARFGGSTDKAEKLRATAKRLRDEIGKLESKTVDVKVNFKLPMISDTIAGANQGGDGIGRAVRGSVAKLAQQSVANGAILPFGSVGKGSASLMGADDDLGPFAALGAGMGLSVGSGLRPGSITSSGNQSWHSSGDAIDMSGPTGGMRQYAQMLYSRFGSRLRELISPWAGLGIKDGKPYRYSAAIQAQHSGSNAHVHVAYTGPFGDGIGNTARVAKAAGFSGAALVNAVAIAGAESRYLDDAQNLKYPDHSIGLWQINQLAHKGRYGSDQALKNPLANAKAAYAVSGGGRNFGPWSTWPSAAAAYLSRARAAVASLTGGGAPGAGGGAGGTAVPGGGGGSGGAAGWAGARDAFRQYQSGQRGAAREAVGGAREGFLGGGASYQQGLADVEVGKARAGDSVAKMIPVVQKELRLKRRRRKVIRKALKGRLGKAARLRLSEELAQLITEIRDLRATLAEYKADKDGVVGDDPEAEGGSGADGGGEGGGEAAPGPTLMDFAQLRVDEAGLTEGLDDDRSALANLLQFRGYDLDAARAGGDPRAISEAIGAWKSAKDALDALNATLASDVADLAIAEASLTSGLDDDKGALTNLLQLRADELNAARNSGDPRRITDAIGAYKSVTDALEQLNGTMDESNRLQQQRDDIAREQVDNQRKILALAQQGPGILAAVIAAVNGDLGSKVGLGFSMPGYAGSVAQY